MSCDIQRVAAATDPVAVTSDVNTTGRVVSGGFAGGTFFCVAASATPVTLQWWAKFSHDSADFRVCDSTNTVLATNVQADRAYPIPDELFGAVVIKAVANTAGQTATLRFALKG